MALDMQEQEQLDAFKAWWKDNGKWLLALLAIVIAGLAAKQGWHSYQGRQSLEASTLYGELNKQVASNDPKRINDAAAMVINKYASSPYAARAALVAAQADIQAGDMTGAKTQLQWVIDHTGEDGLKNVARLKLVSVLLDQQNYAEALRLLDAPHDEFFNALYADLRGDVLQAQGKKEEARTAYQQALAKTDIKSGYRNLIQMKLDGLGGAK